MEALIESGRGHYDAGRYQAALRQFTRATRLCRCTRGLKRERCACKDYEAVAERDDSIFDEAMFTCRCPVGRTFSKCDNRLHIKALDYRAATFEAMGELQRAERDAKWMLELAPRLPDGYLRLGKNARLQKNSWFAWKVYSVGVDANKHASLASPKFLMLHQALQPLRIRFLRKDPMHLPLELVHQIFSDFDVAELTKCLRVSKAWKGKLEGHHSRRLWCFLVFPENLRRAPRSGALKALVKRSGGSACKIVIMDTIGFDLSMDRLAILLRHSPNLQHLELGLADRLHYHFPEFPGRYCNLRHLAMGSEMPNSPPLRSSAAGLTSAAFIQCVAGNLEHLDLCGAPSRWAEQWDLPEFPRLKALRLTWPWRDESPRALPIVSCEPVFQAGGSSRADKVKFSLASKTPRLEQLCLGDLHLESNQSQEWKDSWHTLWSNLKVFTFILPEFCRSPLASPHTISNVTLINSLHAGNTLEHLDLSIMMDDVDESTNQVFSNADDLDRYGLTEADGSPIRRCNEFKNLQSLRLEHFALCPERMKTIFAAALGNGKLHTVDVAMPLEASYDSKVFARTLAAYSWLRGLETIRCLGISRFQLVDVPHCREARSDLISFLASFPNLETLSLSTSYCSDVAMGCLVEELIKTTRVRTIYHKALSGVPMDRLTRLGAQNGVDIIWGSLPRVWPMPLGR